MSGVDRAAAVVVEVLTGDQLRFILGALPGDVDLGDEDLSLDEMQAAVVAALNAQTGVRTTAQHEAEVSAAFARGYDKGALDAQTGDTGQARLTGSELHLLQDQDG